MKPFIDSTLREMKYKTVDSCKYEKNQTEDNTFLKA